VDGNSGQLWPSPLAMRATISEPRILRSLHSYELACFHSPMNVLFIFEFF
jgi:hypothetical protein